MKLIRLSQGFHTLVDSKDYEWLSKFKWTASLESRKTKWYAIRWSKVHEQKGGKRFKIRMHCEIVGRPSKPTDGLVVDHWNGDSLDNTRGNLRIKTQAQNMLNAPGFKIKGVKVSKWL